ncbi:hypothetical protein ACN9MJ_10410 [Acidovorax facilis]|uniref:hypothetical protein n=1 Tax=Acidovorax facilis TaxID=12917 RepID=UPI003CF0C8C7
MTTLPSFLKAGEAKAASQDAAQLAKAARKAQGALEWALAANLWTQAANALQRDPRTGQETLQALDHRRCARNCEAMTRTRVPNQLIKDNPDYRHMTRALIAEEEAIWRRHYP